MGTALLFEGASQGKLDQVRRAIEGGLSPNSIDPCTRQSALHYAAARGRADIIRYLLEKGAEVDLYNHESHRTPFMLAAEWGKVESAKILLAHGANPDFKGQTVVSYTLRGFADTPTKAALLELVYDLSTGSKRPGYKRDTALLVQAARHELLAPGFIRLLLGHYADVNQQLDSNHNGVLHELMYLYTERNREQSALPGAIKAVVDAGADLHMKNFQNHTPEDRARELLEYNPDPLGAQLSYFARHRRQCVEKAAAFDPATDKLLDDGGGPTALLWHLCGERLLDQALLPAKWEGKERELLDVQHSLRQALPKYYANIYDAALDGSALKRDAMPEARPTWLHRCANGSAPSTQAGRMA